MTFSSQAPGMEELETMRQMIDALTKGAWVQCGHSEKDYRITINAYMDQFLEVLSPRGRRLFEAAIAAEEISLAVGAN